MSRNQVAPSQSLHLKKPIPNIRWGQRRQKGGTSSSAISNGCTVEPTAVKSQGVAARTVVQENVIDSNGSQDTGQR